MTWSAAPPSSRSIESIPPFRRSPEVREGMDAILTGRLPDWLRGELVRTCPAVFEAAKWRARHWFDGLCMIYAFRVGAVSIRFQSRLLESEAAGEISGGPHAPGIVRNVHGPELVATAQSSASPTTPT